MKSGWSKLGKEKADDPDGPDDGPAEDNDGFSLEQTAEWAKRWREKMAAKVDIRDPYSSCQEAKKWDAMTVDSFIRQCVSYEASGLHCIRSIANVRGVETLTGRSYWRR